MSIKNLDCQKTSDDLIMKKDLEYHMENLEKSYILKMRINEKILNDKFKTQMKLFETHVANENKSNVKTINKDPSNSYIKAFKESNGFFEDIREHDWNLMKKRQRDTPNCFQNNCNIFLYL